MNRTPDPPDDLSPLLGSTDVAALLGMSREQVWRLWTNGRLPGYRFDRHVRFARRDIERFMSEHYRAVGRRWDASSGPPAALRRARRGGAHASEYRPL